MITPIWLFLSEILFLVMVWFFILEFNEGFSRQEDLERVVDQKILTEKYDLKS